MSENSTDTPKSSLVNTLSILVGLIVLLWVLEGIDFLIFDGGLDQFGIRPRTREGLWGIVWAPFLHGDFAHLIANTAPLFVLGLIILLRGRFEFFVITVLCMAIGGFGTWLTGQSHSVHIGASGVVFGYLGFLLSHGLFERRLLSIAMSVGIGALYGGLIWGVLPGQPGISWQGHLFGFIGGVAAARLIARVSKRRLRRAETKS